MPRDCVIPTRTSVSNRVVLRFIHTPCAVTGGQEDTTLSPSIGAYTKLCVGDAGYDWSAARCDGTEALQRQSS